MKMMNEVNGVLNLLMLSPCLIDILIFTRETIIPPGKKKEKASDLCLGSFDFPPIALPDLLRMPR